ncbi:hypothetical protein NL676_008292 [Syzygium grande]|nr:hypothetical protein NL676_008292 [Syzygium grande]
MRSLPARPGQLLSSFVVVGAAARRGNSIDGAFPSRRETRLTSSLPLRVREVPAIVDRQGRRPVLSRQQASVCRQSPGYYHLSPSFLSLWLSVVCQQYAAAQPQYHCRRATHRRHTPITAQIKPPPGQPTPLANSSHGRLVNPTRPSHAHHHYACTASPLCPRRAGSDREFCSWPTAMPTHVLSPYCSPVPF